MMTTVKLINISSHIVTTLVCGVIGTPEIYSQQISSIQSSIIGYSHRAVHWHVDIWESSRRNGASKGDSEQVIRDVGKLRRVWYHRVQRDF